MTKKNPLRMNVFDDCGVLEETHVDMGESSQTPHVGSGPPHAGTEPRTFVVVS